MKRHFLSLLAALIASTAPAAEPFLEKTDLFEAGKDGYALYRIPGIIVTKKGTALAYCEARKEGKGDWGPIDIVMRRSTDGGKTWLPRQTIVQVKGELPVNPLAAAQNLDKPGDNTANNPVAFADRNGSVHLLYCLEYARCYYIRSDDEGVTWTEPVDITATFEKFLPDYDWKILATGPAHGIQLRTGRLIVPVWLSLGTGGHAHRPSITATIYSDDHGTTWQRGAVAIPDTPEWVYPNETCIVETLVGTVMINARTESKNHRRLINLSRDGGESWAKPRFDEKLLEPICMGSIVRYSMRPAADKNRILFANPHNLDRLDGKAAEGKPRDRRNLSIKLSQDEGKTWKFNQTLEATYGGYSDLAVLPSGDALCLYERGLESGIEQKKSTYYTHLTIARFNLEWVSNGKDSLKGPLNGKIDFGTQRDDFDVAGVEGFVLHPTKPAANGTRPWAWYAPTIGNNPGTGNTWLIQRLLDKGFYVVGLYVGETFANPKSREQFTTFYHHLRQHYQLAPKVTLIAQSRGGLNHYNFAADHPQWIECIAGIYTVCDLRSYPGLERAAPAYGLTPDQLGRQISLHTPVERLAPIAAAKIPILHIHGDSDVVVPIEANSAALAEKYKALGGQMELITIPGKGHEYDPGFFESEKMLSFILQYGLDE
ncbi:dipeptidyl aminopeptidase/acylaminoacyl peptidase [Prosthecobacter fusiformis]|uniref:exo-alpha-sialidase n=1 Tax=Prosthecobacter fusiformis TaxID=48464 RepID=A0A4R7S1J1_9BACT|nr:exo-alpha-sialidase [Prosthecobacter fusiformis]TDU71278.1 dipeptidyl aminopeptidase/acylaminoacyl peptidase [Prosthecobacter fusiformis]